MFFADAAWAQPFKVQQKPIPKDFTIRSQEIITCTFRVMVHVFMGSVGRNKTRSS
jgi:hypothetical protein